jgi:NADH-quinone oxidoreductase subunit N
VNTSVCAPESMFLLPTILPLMYRIFGKQHRDLVLGTYLCSPPILVLAAVSVWLGTNDTHDALVEIFILFASFVTLAMTYNYNKAIGIPSYEYYIVMLLSICSFRTFTKATNIISPYVLMELQSISSYVSTSIYKRNRYSIEAGPKYLIPGSFSSTILLFGFSILYGFTGLVHIADLSLHIKYMYAAEDDFTFITLLISSPFINVGPLSKIYASPSHPRIADIYQGSPTSVTMFISTVPVVSYAYLHIKLYISIFSDLSIFYDNMLYIVAISSMMAGASGAFIQKRIKKLIAYSSVSAIGYVLAGLSGDNIILVQQCLLYIPVYIMNISPIFVILVNYRVNNVTNIDSINSFASIYAQNRLLFLTMCSLSSSLAGVPPFAGFASKLFLSAAIGYESLFSLLFLRVVTAIFSCYYHIKVVKMVYYENAPSSFLHVDIAYVPVSVSVPFSSFNISFLSFSTVIEDICPLISISPFSN